jgi:hypothetical protein
MALADYKLCDQCGGKAFYDTNLSYSFSEKVSGAWKNPDDPFKEVGEYQEGASLDYLGDWAVLCLECAKTHKTVIVKIEAIV